MDISAAVKEYLVAVRKKKPLTVQGYKQRLAVFIQYCEEKGLPLEKVTYKVVDNFLDHLSSTRVPHHANRKEIAPITLQGYVRVIKGFMGWCAEDEFYSEYVSLLTVKRIKLPKIEQRIIEPFTEEHIKKLLKACEKGSTEHIRMRDRCIIIVLLNTGIRANELCTLKIKDTHLDADDSYIKVMGKGSKEREVSINKETRLELRKYVRKFREKSLGVDSTFVSRNMKDPLGVWGLDEVFSRLNEWAEITDVRVSPHTMRHTFASNWIKNGGDVYHLSKTLGHSSLETTEKYLRSLSARDVRRSQ